MEMTAPSHTPGGRIRLRFAAPEQLDSAAALFGSAHPDREGLALAIPSDGSLPVLRAVIAALDEAGIAPETITAHSGELDDVFAALGGPSWSGDQDSHWEY
ncbi:hypothetical protein ACFYNO_29190 [Kitasatospora sp. NPDC006697]|uniref:hypothetical protein n=1 Tax=Kitasatospora sp. NPDC006697 TaxID=3364020 RepID=UPI00369B375A